MIKIIHIFYIAFLMLSSSIGISQSTENSIGVLYHDVENASEGYTLFYPEQQNIVFLIDNCGRIVNQWEGEPTQGPGKEVYLLEDGSILKANTQGNNTYTNTFGTGGAGGVIELRSWENEILWSTIVADSLNRQHHDVHPMPNGNILMIVWERKFLDEVIEAGFDTLTYSQDELWPDKIIEVNPSTNETVWEWKTWDHLVQDFDSTKVNFGGISENKGRIDLNYQDFVFGRQDIHHINSVDYNEDLDQILVSCRNFNELWIIDHSTTTEEAASNTGGNSDKGGEILWRWGNDNAYDMASAEDQKLFRPHYASWIDSPIQGNTFQGMIGVYNNFIDDGLSKGQVLNPTFDTSSFNYTLENEVYLPSEFETEIVHPDTSKTFSTAGSSIEFLENDNIIMCAARQGRIFEVTSGGELVWEYLVPMRNGFPIAQGSTISLSENFTFSARKYGVDYPAFDNRDLTPGDYIELNPNESACMTTSVFNFGEQKTINIYPNPVSNILNIESISESDYLILNILGKEMSRTIGKTTSEIDVSSFPSGLYYIQDLSSKIVVAKFFKI